MSGWNEPPTDTSQGWNTIPDTSDQWNANPSTSQDVALAQQIQSEEFNSRVNGESSHPNGPPALKTREYGSSLH